MSERHTHMGARKDCPACTDATKPVSERLNLIATDIAALEHYWDGKDGDVASLRALATEIEEIAEMARACATEYGTQHHAPGEAIVMQRLADRLAPRKVP